MSKNNFRRGAAAIRAASLPRDVDEALDRLDVDIIGERGDEIAHTCPECGSEYAKTNREKGVYFCPCGWQGRHWLGSSSNRSATPKRPEYDIEPVWGEGIEPSPSVVSEWDYRDEHGNVVQTIHRREVPIINDDGNKILGTRKKFEVSHDKGLALVWGAPGKHEQVPYRLPELLAADPSEPVWVTEGEKDCDALAALGLVATCEAGYVANSKEAGRTLLWGRVPRGADPQRSPHQDRRRPGPGRHQEGSCAAGQRPKRLRERRDPAPGGREGRSRPSPQRPRAGRAGTPARACPGSSSRIPENRL